jgi:hypothetical protein
MESPLDWPAARRWDALTARIHPSDAGAGKNSCQGRKRGPIGPNSQTATQHKFAVTSQPQSREAAIRAKSPGAAAGAPGCGPRLDQRQHRRFQARFGLGFARSGPARWLSAGDAAGMFDESDKRSG